MDARISRNFNLICGVRVRAGVWRCFYQDKNGVKVEEDASIVILKYGIDKYHQGRIPFPGFFKTLTISISFEK